MYLGVEGSTGEVIIGTAGGVWRTRTVRKRPEEMRWNDDEIEQIKGVPWDKKNEKEEDDVVRPRRGIEKARGNAAGGEAGRNGRVEEAEILQHEGQRL